MAFGSVQTTYNINIVGALRGMLADLNDAQTVTGILADPDTTAAFPAGIMVAYLDTPLSDQVQNLDVSTFAPGGTAPPAGIIIHTHATDTIGLQTETTDLLFKQGSALSLLTKGIIYVISEADVVQGDPVYVRYSANGGNTELGGFSNASDGGHNTLLRGSYFLSAGTAGTPVKLSFDMNAALTAL
jgi:hypothetical protein